MSHATEIHPLGHDDYKIEILNPDHLAWPLQTWKQNPQEPQEKIEL